MGGGVSFFAGREAAGLVEIDQFISTQQDLAVLLPGMMPRLVSLGADGVREGSPQQGDAQALFLWLGFPGKQRQIELRDIPANSGIGARRSQAATGGGCHRGQKLQDERMVHEIQGL